MTITSITSETMNWAEPVNLPCEVVELVARAALPVVAALDDPTTPEAVAYGVRSPLEKLCARWDLPIDFRVAAESALAATRRIPTGERASYADLLRAMHWLLVESGLPVPTELVEDGTVGGGLPCSSTRRRRS